MNTAKKLRLDELLVARGLTESRAQAKALIMSGRVLRGTERLDKPGKEFPADLDLTIEQPPRFVSRGGEKLAAAITAFALDVRGAHVLDVGASTGGFTDCVLQAGAAIAWRVSLGRRWSWQDHVDGHVLRGGPDRKQKALAFSRLHGRYA